MKVSLIIFAVLKGLAMKAFELEAKLEGEPILDARKHKRSIGVLPSSPKSSLAFS